MSLKTLLFQVGDNQGQAEMDGDSIKFNQFPSPYRVPTFDFPVPVLYRENFGISKRSNTGNSSRYFLNLLSNISCQSIKPIQAWFERFCAKLSSQSVPDLGTPKIEINSRSLYFKFHIFMIQPIAVNKMKLQSILNLSLIHI